MLRRGAAAGALAWSTYAIVENLLLVVLPRLLSRGDAGRELDAAISAFLFVLYPLLGALAGAAAGAVLSRLGRLPDRNSAPTAGRLAAVAMIPLALATGAILRATDYLALRLQLAGLATSLAAVGLLALVAGSRRPLVALRALAAPWTLAILLLGAPWVCDHVGAAPLTAALAGLTFVATVAGLSLLVARTRARRRAAPPIKLGCRALGLAVVSLVLAGFGATVHEMPRLSPPPVAALSRAPHPNVVLITLDTVRADHLSLYGYARDTSPWLRELAARSTLYLRAIAPADMTLATHASIFTGLYPTRHGAHYDRKLCPQFCALDEDDETLAELLEEHGYRTAAVVANFGFLGHFFRLDQGFELHDARRNVIPLLAVEPYTLRQALQALAAPHLSAEYSDRVYRTAGAVTDLAIAQVDRLRAEGSPFFLFLNYMDAHEPYMPPPPWDRLYPGRDPAFRRADRQALEKRVLRAETRVTPRQLAHLTSQYDGGIAYIDAELARLCRHLEATGLFEDALIIVTSDHGEAFGEHALFGHNVAVYQEQVRVPLLVHFPAERAALRVDALASLADLFPTILETAGVPVPPGLDGRSLVGEPVGDERPVVSETFGNDLAGRWQPGLAIASRAIFDGNLKLIVPAAGDRELYDLDADPGEAVNLYRQDPRRRELERRLDLWLRDAARAGAGRRRPLDAETAASLRALGYL